MTPEKSNEKKESDKSDEKATKSTGGTVNNSSKASAKPSVKSQNDNEVEDVPQDFFDDFSNPDFMEGLNIVDAWDEAPDGHLDEIQPQKESDAKKKSPENRKVERKKPPARCPVVVSRSRAEKRRRGRERKKVEERSSIKKEISKEDDLRRDPSKSKRDLEKYKVKCDKDKEQKTITEKLKVVETGLVPPGMEMDVDVDEVMKQAKKNNNQDKCPELDDQWQPSPTAHKGKIVYPDLKPSAVLPEKALKKRSRHRSRSRDKTRFETAGNSAVYEVGPVQQKRRSPERAQERRPRSKSAERVHRGFYADRNRKDSRDMFHPASLSHQERRSFERRSLSRERQYLRRSDSRDRLKRGIRSRSRDRRSASRGRRRRSRSLSEREAWMRDPKRAWRRSRTRSRSPKRKRYDEKKEKKISFLEEIHQLLTGTAQPGMPAAQQHAPPVPQHLSHLQPPHPMMPPMRAPVPGPVPAPVPVPPPINQFNFSGPVRPPVDMYDQRFFIGDSSAPPGGMPVLPGPRPHLIGPPQPVPMMGPQGCVPSAPVITEPVPCPIPKPLPNHTQSPNTRIVPTNNTESVKQTPLEKCLSELKNLGSRNEIALEVKTAAADEVKKLYEQKKITLSDFLSMTTKLADFSTSTANLPKKIQVISRCQEVMKQLGDANDTSGRLILKLTNREKTPEADFLSPLLKKPVKYSATTPQKQEIVSSFTKKLNKLLASAGLATQDKEVEEQEAALSPPEPPSISRGRNSVKTGMSSLMQSKSLAKMVQTDPMKCKRCEERDDIIFIHAAAQCSVSVRSIGVQATEDPLKEMLKNKPLAALTPAQLLMNEKDTERVHISEERRLGYPGAHDFGFDRIGNFRDGRSAPTRVHFSPPRRMVSPPRRLGSPSLNIHDRSIPYVPTGPPVEDLHLPKRPMYPVDYYYDDKNPDRYFRR